MAVATKILKLLDNALDIEEMQTSSLDKNFVTEEEKKDSFQKIANVTGKLYPCIKINGYTLSEDEISYMELDESGFVPTIKVIINDIYGVLGNMTFPKDKCILKLFLQSGSDNIKAIRSDFLICNITPSMRGSNQEQSNFGIGMTYALTGIMNIPNLFNYDINCLNMTSYDALFEIAKKIKVGFATNEVFTNDSMNWIQPNIQYDDYIKDITEHSYKDDQSFFCSFIDRYCNLNFVNLHEMMSTEEDYDATFLFDTMTSIDKDGSLINSTEKQETSDAFKLILSNANNNRGTNLYINQYNLTSDQGNILLNAPNTRNLYYYDIEQSKNNDEKFLDYFVKPYKVYEDDTSSLNENIINEWKGVKIGNEHENFFFSEASNNQNIFELDKTKMNISTEGINLGIIRCMRLPILIIKDSRSEAELVSLINKRNYERSKELDDYGFFVDENLSGYYIVKSIKIIYMKNNYTNKFSTEISLWKGNWSSNY